MNPINKLCANLKQYCLNGQSGMRITYRLKEIKKRRALIGKQRVVVLINSVGKRTVMLLIPSMLWARLKNDIADRHESHQSLSLTVLDSHYGLTVNDFNFIYKP